MPEDCFPFDPNERTSSASEIQKRIEKSRKDNLDKIVKQHEEIIKEKAKSNPAYFGWVCPVCGRGVAPFTSHCPCKPMKYEITC